jgi:hypothetical protein
LWIVNDDEHKKHASVDTLYNTLVYSLQIWANPYRKSDFTEKRVNKGHVIVPSDMINCSWLTGR